MDETAQENAPRKRVVRFGEVADVVISEIADGRAILPAAATRVLGHCHAEFDAPPPQRLVVIRTIEGDGIDLPSRIPRIAFVGRRGNRPLLVAPQHDRSEAPLLDRIFQLVKRFVRGN